MAQARTDALVDRYNTEANLNLSAEQQQNLKALLSGAAERVNARRQAGKEVVEQLNAAVQSNDNAAAEQLLQKLREGFRQVSQGRETVLDEFDRVLQPQQRARLVLALVQQAREGRQALEHVVDNLFTQVAEN